VKVNLLPGEIIEGGTEVREALIIAKQCVILTGGPILLLATQV